MNYHYFEIKNKEGLMLRGTCNEAGAHASTAVIFYHGFTGDRIGRHFLYSQFAERFCAEKVDFYRFDFAGSGESDGSFDRMTMSGEIDDACAIFDFVKATKKYDRVFVMGSSMGGFVATVMTEAREVDGLILLAPAADMPMLIGAGLDQAERFDERYIYGGLLLRPDFLEDLKLYDCYKSAKKYNGPVLIVHGDRDETVSEESNHRLTSCFSNGHFVSIPFADHNFMHYKARQDLFRVVLEFIWA